MAQKSVLESVLQKEKGILISCLVIIILISWIYILSGAGMGMDILKMTLPNTKQMQSMNESPSLMNMDFMAPAVWNTQYIILMFFMWWIMMIAMMLPSASPTILLHAQVIRKNYSREKYLVPTIIFTLGYIFSWGVFSMIATYTQWRLESLGLLSSMMSSNNIILGSSLLLMAGIYQLTPFKHACLQHCRNPMQFLTKYWRNGMRGAFQMGLHHGIYCLGCCWFLMALLYVGGVMNLFWISGLAIFVLLEKTIQSGYRLAKITGIFLILWGAWLMSDQYLF